MINNNIIKNIMLLILGYFMVGCAGSTIQLKMGKRNPTSYIYKYPITQIVKIIDNHLLNNYIYNPITDKDKHYYQSQSMLDSLSTRNYDFAYSLEKYLLRDSFSKEYLFLNKDSVQYNYYLLLLLKQINKDSTFCEIITIDPELVVGQTLTSSCIGSWSGHPSYFYKYVKSSTIEEYEVLLNIGKTLGCEKDMPPLILPEGSNTKK